MQYSKETNIQIQNTIFPKLTQYPTLVWRNTFSIYTTFNFINISEQVLRIIQYYNNTTQSKGNLVCKWIVWQNKKTSKHSIFTKCINSNLNNLSTSYNAVSISWRSSTKVLPYIFTSTVIRSNIMRLRIKKNTTINYSDYLQVALNFFSYKLNHYFILNTLIKQKQLFSFWSHNVYDQCTKTVIKPLKCSSILFQTTSFKFL